MRATRTSGCDQQWCLTEGHAISEWHSNKETQIFILKENYVGSLKSRKIEFGFKFC